VDGGKKPTWTKENTFVLNKKDKEDYIVLELWESDFGSEDDYLGVA
jgi:hypothetical protein